MPIAVVSPRLGVAAFCRGKSRSLAKLLREKRSERAKNWTTKQRKAGGPMAHIVTVATTPNDPGVLYLCTPPEMSSTMGGFGPARFVGNNPPVVGASYVIGADDLPRFRVYCANRGVRVVEPPPPMRRARPSWAERPLPECIQCGQPVARGVTPSFCPNCGRPWQPIEHGPSRDHQPPEPRRLCMQCGRHTPAAFSHCTECGATNA